MKFDKENHEALKKALAETRALIDALPEDERIAVCAAAIKLRYCVMSCGHVPGVLALSLVYAEAVAVLSEPETQPCKH